MYPSVERVSKHRMVRGDHLYPMKVHGRRVRTSSRMLPCVQATAKVVFARRCHEACFRSFHSCVGLLQSSPASNNGLVRYAMALKALDCRSHHHVNTPVIKTLGGLLVPERTMHEAAMAPS
jgi:hypothetical protein